MIVPPGPPPAPIVGSLPAMRRDTLGFLDQITATYGPVVRVRFGPLTFYIVTDLAHIHDILITHADKLHKGPIYKIILARFLGDGLLTSDGDTWKRQRKMVQPAFHTGRINAYAETMTAYTLNMVGRWHDGETRDLHRDMMALTLEIVAKTLFDADMAAETAWVSRVMDSMVRLVVDEIRSPVMLPGWVPTPGHVQGWRAKTRFDQLLGRVIDQRRRTGADHGDLLSMLLLARDESGAAMTDRQILDEALTLFVAGHETTAGALAWTCYLLAQHPDIDTHLHDEISRVLNGRPPTLADVRNLPYTEQVIKEAMRLYPPVWGISRRATAPFQLGDYPVEAGTGVLIPIWTVHRRPDLWDAPHIFRPERFAPEHEATRPKFSYLPFGGGGRICIGNAFAMLEARLVLATVVQRYRFETVPNTPVTPEAYVTLRPAGGVPLRLRERVTSRNRS